MSFKGSLNSGRVENHSFTTKDKLLVALGLGAFSKNNCYAIYEKLMPALMVAFPGIYNNNSGPPFAKDLTILDLAPPIGYFLHFNRITKKFDTERSLSLGDMYSLIEYHEKRQQGRVPPSINTDRLIRDIQNSKSGSVRMQFSLQAIIPDQPGYALIELFFQKKANRDSSRKMTNIGPPMYTGGTKTPAGTSYAGAGTRDHQANSASNTGSYLPQAEGGSKNPYNSTTAPLKLHYNSTDKVFEAGTTQTLAKLLTNLPGADVNKAAPSPSANVTSNSEFYDPKGRYYSGNFTSGLAMPLNIEHGNPYLFGPNIVECQEKTIEKIRVVNRSPKSFSAGEVVMLSSLNGEWIVSSLGEAITKPRPASAQDWAFCKMIVDSDSFFKDFRYYKNEDYEKYSKNITPSFYDFRARLQFYYGSDSNPFSVYRSSMKAYQDIFGPNNLTAELCYYNFDTRKEIDGKANPNYVGRLFTNFEDDAKIELGPSDRYIATTVFDLLNISQGGFLDDSVTKVNSKRSIDKINAFDETFNEFTSMSEIFPFWGPVFTDGYTSLSTSQAKLPINQADDAYFSRNVESAQFTDMKNIPAEISSKIIDIVSTRNDIGKLGSSSSNGVRTNILYPPFYYSTPTSTTHIQFIPLTDTLVGHTDRMTLWAQRYKNERNFLTQTYGPNGLIENLEDKHLHGNIKERNKHIDLTEASLLIKTQCFSSNYGLNYPWPGFSGPLDPNIPVIRYDCYVKRPSTKIAIGAPQYFRDTGDYLGANCVGITAGMCKITKDGGGDINFEVKQDVGLAAEPHNTGTTYNITDIAGLFGTLFGFNSGGITYDNPQWGSSDDGIDSFGTTALHIRIFDDWPDKDTFFDPRYFAVLHFNAVPDPLDEATLGYLPAFGELPRYQFFGSKFGDLVNKYGDNVGNFYLQADGVDPPKDEYGKITVKYITYEERPRSVDKIECDVDFRVPTLDTAVTLGTRTLGNIPDKDTGTVLMPGTQINKGTQIRPEAEWRVNPIRRGQLLTGGGFYYFKSVIGLDQGSGAWVQRGTGFKPKDVIKCENGVVITVTQITDDGNGGIANFEFIKEDTDIPYLKNAGKAELCFGEGFLPSDFASSETVLGVKELVNGEWILGTCYKLTIPSTSEDGEPAILEYYYGRVWGKLMYDAPPVEHVPVTRISVGSKKGQIGRTSDLSVQQSVSKTLSPNESGDYRLFTFFHNDIGSTPATQRTFSPGYRQYLDLNIT